MSKEIQINEPENLTDDAMRYPKIYELGESGVTTILQSPVYITEKVDGSQFGFGILDGQLVMRSYRRQIFKASPPGNFATAVSYCLELESGNFLPEGYFFYTEYLHKPKHITLAYNRIPKNNLILFGVRNPDGSLAEDNELEMWASKLGIESVPILGHGLFTVDDVMALMDRDSILGGQKVEGVVMKRYGNWYDRRTKIDLPVMATKVVSEKFRERHIKDWNDEKAAKGRWEIFQETFKTEARWQKAFQHLYDDGALEGAPRDIGALVKEVHRDIAESHEDEIKQVLWDMYSKGLMRTSTSGLAEWYKAKLHERALEAEQE